MAGRSFGIRTEGHYKKIKQKTNLTENSGFPIVTDPLASETGHN